MKIDRGYDPIEYLSIYLSCVYVCMCVCVSMCLCAFAARNLGFRIAMRPLAENRRAEASARRWDGEDLWFFFAPEFYCGNGPQTARF